MSSENHIHFDIFYTVTVQEMNEYWRFCGFALRAKKRSVSNVERTLFCNFTSHDCFMGLLVTSETVNHRAKYLRPHVTNVSDASTVTLTYVRDTFKTLTFNICSHIEYVKMMYMNI